MKDSCLAIDLGTSAVKVLLVNKNGVQQRARRAYTGVGSEAWLHAVQAALADIPPEARREIGMIGLSSQVGTYITDTGTVIPWDAPAGREELLTVKSAVSADAWIEKIAMEHPYLQCNAQLLEGYVPDVAAVKAVDNFENFLTRKLFTYNAASCVIAYIGAQLGYTDYGEAANDPLVLALLDKNYAATNCAMCMKFGYDPQDQKEFAALSKAKFCDRTIVDTVARNAREPHRKLGAGERIIGAAKLLRSCGQNSSVLELTAAAALLYNDPKDAVWSAMKAENSDSDILKTVCGLEESEPLYQSILGMLHRLRAEGRKAIVEAAKGRKL